MVAYAAAVIDTQGVIRLREAGGTLLPMVALHSPNMELLDWFAEITGTKVTRVTRDYQRAPCVDHCQERHQHIKSVSGRWSVTGVRATVLLFNVRSHLRFQIDAAQEALAVGLSAPFKPATPKKMEALGWEVPLFG